MSSTHSAGARTLGGMSILSLILAIVVVGVVLWLVNTFVPMEPRVKQILNVVVIIALVLWLLQGFGVLGYLDRPAFRR